MSARRASIVALALAVVAGAWGLPRVLQSQSSDVAQPAPALRRGTFDSASGLKPLPEIVDFWRSRAEASPSDYISHTHLAVTLTALARATGDLSLYEEARKPAEQALEVNPNYAPALLALARIDAAGHNFAAAFELADQVHERQPRSLDALAIMGDAKLELGDYAAAGYAFDALAEAGRTAPVVSRLARLALLEGRNDEATQLAAEAVQLSADLVLRPNDAAFYWFQLGHHRYQAGDVGDAATALEQARTIAPGHLAATEVLAGLRAGQGRYDEAITLYAELLEAGPAADLHGELSTIYGLVGNGDAAAEQLRLGLALAAVTLDAYPSERRHIATFLINHDPETALGLAQQDFATRQDVYAYDTLAWALFANGQLEEAADAIDAALAVGTRDAELLYHAGRIYVALGDDSRGSALLEDALALNPAFDPVHAPLAEALLG